MSTLNGVTFNRTGNPQADLITYANARGISESEAKAELQSAFGEPTQMQNFSFDSQDEEDDFSLTGDPQADAKTYADLNGISLSSAISKLRELFGEPEVEEGEYDEVEAEEDTDDTNTDNTTTSTSESDSKAQDRKNLQNEIAEWNAKLKQATDASDQWGIFQAQSNLKKLQTQAYNWDNTYFNS